MALAVAVISKVDVGDRQEIVMDVTFDSSYPTGGEADTPIVNEFRIGLLEDVKGSGLGRIVSYDAANGLVLVHEDQAVASAAALDEVPDTTDLSALVVRCTCKGR